jgi:formylglycine-generating enzyme required for sulfatase activity
MKGKQGMNIKSMLAVLLAMMCVCAARAQHAFTDKAQYLVVDLSARAKNYSVRYSAVPPDLRKDICRTKEMWFRLIPAGTFMMGSPADELGRKGGEDLHEVTLTQPFYIGIFEVTQRQWELVMGANPSQHKGDTRPVEKVSYTMIRGSGKGAQWPADNSVDVNAFFGKLRSRIALAADLPTEAQWEYACRAGTTTAVNTGKNLADSAKCPNMAEAGRCKSNKNDGKGGYTEHTVVGMYQPNAWGLYDMHGNVTEWCLDWHTGGLGTEAVTDPKGMPSPPDTRRILRGGHHWAHANWCRSALRASEAPDFCDTGVGFRAAIHFDPALTAQQLGARTASSAEDGTDKTDARTNSRTNELPPAPPANTMPTDVFDALYAEKFADFPPALKKLHATYTNEVSKLENARTFGYAAALEEYSAGLARLPAVFAQKADVEGVRAVQAAKEKTYGGDIDTESDKPELVALAAAYTKRRAAADAKADDALVTLIGKYINALNANVRDFLQKNDLATAELYKLEADAADRTRHATQTKPR